MKTPQIGTGTVPVKGWAGFGPPPEKLAAIRNAEHRLDQAKPKLRWARRMCHEIAENLRVARGTTVIAAVIFAQRDADDLLSMQLSETMKFSEQVDIRGNVIPGVPEGFKVLKRVEVAGWKHQLAQAQDRLRDSEQKLKEWEAERKRVEAEYAAAEQELAAAQV